VRTDAAIDIPAPLTVTAEEFVVLGVWMSQCLFVHSLRVHVPKSPIDKTVTISMLQREEILPRLTTTLTLATIKRDELRSKILVRLAAFSQILTIAPRVASKRLPFDSHSGLDFGVHSVFLIIDASAQASF